MSFYGNITSNNKTQFKFEKKYATEDVMNTAAAGDGVFVGGYVLVENNSTVWQKIQTADSQFKYVMIAELNSVVPTFDLIVDAPGEAPINPQFAPESTNVHYKLHVQPSWGLRVAEATDEEGSDVLDNNKRLAIYFNNNGFNPDSKDSQDNNRENYIKIESAQSGNIYGKDDNNPGSAADDIKEIKISLPAIGNAVSEVYDLIHGINRDNAQPSMQGYINFFTNLPQNQIPIASDDKTIIGVDVGTLPLTGLNLEEEIKDEDINIAATDSINTAFVKVTKQFTNTDMSIQGAITELTDKITTTNNRIDKQANWNQEDSAADDYIKNKPNFTDFVTKATEFTYGKNDNIQFKEFKDDETEDFNIQALYAKVWKLEKRIRDLEMQNN